MGYSLARKTGKPSRLRRVPALGCVGLAVAALVPGLPAGGTEPACQVCNLTLAEAGSLDLHHTSYKGVHINANGTFKADEPDKDLLPYCRDHHQALHKILDDRRSDYWGWDRRRATTVITAILARKHEKKRTP